MGLSLHAEGQVARHWARARLGRTHLACRCTRRRAALRLKVRAGIDPLEERAREAAEALAAAQAAEIAGITFKAVAETYIAANEESWRNAKHRQQWRNTLASYVYPVIGDLPVAEVDTAMC